MQPTNTIGVNVVECLSMTACAAAVGYSPVEWLKIFQRWRFTFLRRIAQVFVEAAVGSAPCRFIDLLQPLAEPFAHQRMGIERVRRRDVYWRQQPRGAQA